MKIDNIDEVEEFAKERGIGEIQFISNLINH